MFEIKTANFPSNANKYEEVLALATQVASCNAKNMGLGIRWRHTILSIY